MVHLRHHAMGIALTVVFALGWSAATGCADAAQASAPQMACCLKGHQECEHAAQSMACCKSTPSRVADQQSTAAKPTPSTLVPVLDLVRFVDPLPVTVATAQRPLRRFDQGPARPPDIPTYLLDSVFLL